MAATTIEVTGMHRMRTDWGAIWAGMFSFIAIWSVFGSLGLAIFAGTTTSAVNHPVTGMAWGLGIWAIVLTIIAMYVGGRVTGHLAGISRRSDGMLHGQVMFGLSCVAALILAVLAGNSLTGGPAAPGTAQTYAVVSGMGWAGFIALLLRSRYAALGGAASGVRRQAEVVPDIHTTTEERPAIRRGLSHKPVTRVAHSPARFSACTGQATMPGTRCGKGHEPWSRW